MITTYKQAVAVQQRRVAAGKKGRAKAVRRWFKREYGASVDAHVTPVLVTHDGTQVLRADLKSALEGDFTGCRTFDETHKS